MRRRIAAACLAAGLGLALVPGVAAADEIRDGQWYLDTLGINEAHQLSQGAGVTIGVIDTGVNADHPDLKGQVLPGTDLVHSDRDGLTDTYGHGTGVASILVGANDGTGVLGIAPAAKVISVNIIADGAETNDGSLMGPAIEWLIDNGADIITTSVAGNGDRASQSAINRATDNGIPVVAAVGNRYQDVGFGQEELSATGLPAAQKGVIPVTGTTTDNTFWEDGLDLKLASPQPQLGLSAPATSIPVATTSGGYSTRNGTSLAAPIVAGTLALIKSAYPDLDYWGQMYRLMLTADDKGPEGYDDQYGWGIVNPLAALTADVELQDGTISPGTDILPLEEQGQPSDDSTEPNGDKDPTAEPSDDQALTGTDTGTPLWIPIAITATALLAAAIILTLILRKKRHRANTPSPHPPTQPGPAAPQYQSPPHS